MRISKRARVAASSLAWLNLLLVLGQQVTVAAPQPDARVDRSELAELLGSDSNEGFRRAIEPREFVFPQDHGPHPDFRNEWWYVTGNLDSEKGRRFGFELTIFRFALTPDRPATDSSWRTNQVYIAHFAVTDAAGERFVVAERFSRGALGLAGAQAEPFRVWINDWSIASAGNGSRELWRLSAADEEMALDLTLTAQKPVVVNGKDGLSQKSAEAGNASYYYSITRWLTEGRLRIGQDSFVVSGTSWLDREWSSSALGANQEGWDWFALQLSDGSDLMFYSLRNTDGSQDAYSAGTLVAADGRSRHIDRADVELSVNAHWESPEGGRYPAGWEMRLRDHELDLLITPVLDDQELFTTVRYWEGAVDIMGTRAGKPVSGRGYVELTGYAPKSR